MSQTTTRLTLARTLDLAREDFEKTLGEDALTRLVEDKLIIMRIDKEVRMYTSSDTEGIVDMLQLARGLEKWRDIEEALTERKVGGPSVEFNLLGFDHKEASFMLAATQQILEKLNEKRSSSDSIVRYKLHQAVLHMKKASHQLHTAIDLINAIPDENQQ